MTRFGSIVLCGALAAAFVGCSSSSDTTKPPKDPTDLVPRDQTVSGWTIDRTNSKTGGKVAATAVGEIETESLIDGGCENYYQDPYMPKMFLWQNYVNATLASAPDGATVKLYVFEMPSEEQAKGIFTAILQRPNYAGRTGMPNDWQATAPAVGSESRVQDTGSQWWVNFHSGVFYVEVLLGPSYGPPPDYPEADTDNRQEAVRFAQGVASKI
jgi:hypothetical protein